MALEFVEIRTHIYPHCCQIQREVSACNHSLTTYTPELPSFADSQAHTPQNVETHHRWAQCPQPHNSIPVDGGCARLKPEYG